ncbi:Hypothetical predicted protein, partial [Marmota monax]
LGPRGRVVGEIEGKEETKGFSSGLRRVSLTKKDELVSDLFNGVGDSLPNLLSPHYTKEDSETR